ncbi:unnamed protein product [Rhodiola kirilowii]
MSAEPTSPQTPNKTYAATVTQPTSICTRGMTQRMAVNAAAASLRASQVPRRERTYTVASIMAAATAVIASNSARHKGSVKADGTPSPKAKVTLPKQAEPPKPCVASVMTIGTKTMEEQMQELREMLELVLKDNQEENKKLEELQKEVVGLGKRKVEEVNLTAEEVPNEVEEVEADQAPEVLEDGGQSTVDDLKEVNLRTTENPRPIYVSTLLTEEEEEQYLKLLAEYKDVFAWNYTEMSGLNPKVALHRLAIKRGVGPKKQSQRRFRPELVPEIEKEVNKLIDTDFIREVEYPTWIANLVPVRKKNGQLRVCVDFRDLNEACPKDDFPLPVTELMIDATTGHEDLSFMDCMAGYKIHMAPEDQDATAFQTPKGIFCYKVMPFGLKNAGATYQRAMQTIFEDMMHKTIECYVDDVVVKLKARSDHVQDLRTVFERLRECQLKMNPLKCAFGVTSGKFLGFVVTHRGIEIDHTKIKAIQEMPEPKSLKELRGLQGRLVYIRRFISNLAWLCQPIIDFLDHQKLPADPRHKIEIRRRAPRFIHYKGTLYRRSFLGQWLRCLSEEEAVEVMQEAHAGICGAHQSGPKLYDRIKRMGYYWPTVVQDCVDFAKKCNACQFNANFIHQPPEHLHPTVASWPFEAWGLDVVGPINPKASNGHTYILAATDYFSKWAEVVTLREVKKENVVDFIKKHIIFRFGVPQRIVVGKSKCDWHEKIGEALWAYQTTYKTPTQATPYALVYGVEAVLPLELQIPSMRIAIQEGLSSDENNKLRLAELEALDEKRLQAQQSLQCYQARLSRAFNRKVRPRSFQKGDLVLAVRRPIITSHKTGSKFKAKWDGPYVVQEAYTNGAYKIVDQEGLRVGPINGKFLKRYYS